MPHLDKKKLHTCQCFPARWNVHGKMGLSSSQRWTLKAWSDGTRSAHCHQCQGLFIPILDFHSAKWLNKPLVPPNRGSPPALQMRAAMSYCKAAGSSQCSSGLQGSSSACFHRRLNTSVQLSLKRCPFPMPQQLVMSAVAWPDTQTLSCREGEAHHTGCPCV